MLVLQNSLSLSKHFNRILLTVINVIVKKSERNARIFGIKWIKMCMKSPSMRLSVWCYYDTDFAAARYGIRLNGCTWRNRRIWRATYRSTWRRKKWCWIRCIVIAFRKSPKNRSASASSVVAFNFIGRKKRVQAIQWPYLELSFDGVPNNVFFIFSVVFDVRRLLLGLVMRSGRNFEISKFVSDWNMASLKYILKQNPYLWHAKTTFRTI